MQRSVLSVSILALLASSTLACSLVGGVPATPTLVPSPIPSTATDSPTNEPPTLVPTSIPRVAELPTSTPVRLGTGSNPLPGLPAAPALPGGVPVTNANGASAFAVTNIPIGGSMLEVPAETSLVPIDFDISRTGHGAIIAPDGSMTVDGAGFNAAGKLLNKHYGQVRWSPDGRWLAFTIQTPDAEKLKPGCDATHDDGLWLVDSASNSNPQQIYRNHYGQACDGDLRVIQDINWAWDNDAMMLTVRYPVGLAQVLVGKAVHADDQHPGLFNLLLYSQGTWQPDSQGFVTVTDNPGQPNVLGILHRDVGQFTQIADGGALGLTMQDAAQLGDGRYAFLGKPSAFGPDATQLALYVLTPGSPPVVVSAALPGTVVAASWSADRSALLVLLAVGGQFQMQVVTPDGTITDYTPQTRGSGSAHWNRQQ